MRWPRLAVLLLAGWSGPALAAQESGRVGTAVRDREHLQAPGVRDWSWELRHPLARGLGLTIR
jgi:hypothetical protein